MSAITLYAKAMPAFDARLGHALAALQSAAEAHPGQVVQASSLGAEDMVITDLIARHQIDVRVATLDTGALHAETLALIPRIAARYGITVTAFQPAADSVLRFVRDHGDQAMYKSLALRKECCGLRKLEPLARMLEGANTWVTGLRREQSGGRGGVPFEELDSAGRTKLSPLADWSWSDVWHYISNFDVPYNPLHDHFMPSIGCAPCTRAIAVGEDFRAGRWWWETDTGKECGLHVKPTADTTASSITGALA